MRGSRVWSPQSPRNRGGACSGTPVGKWDRTPYQLFGMRQAAASQLGGAAPELIAIAGAAMIGERDVAAAENALREQDCLLICLATVQLETERAEARGIESGLHDLERGHLLAQATSGSTIASSARRRRGPVPRNSSDFSRRTSAS